jgi:hypothetical protein
VLGRKESSSRARSGAVRIASGAPASSASTRSEPPYPCTVTRPRPPLDAETIAGLPAWMLDAAACARHGEGTSMVEVGALTRVAHLLEAIRLDAEDGTPRGDTPKEATDESEVRLVSANAADA